MSQIVDFNVTKGVNSADFLAILSERVAGRGFSLEPAFPKLSPCWRELAIGVSAKNPELLTIYSVLRTEEARMPMLVYDCIVECGTPNFFLQAFEGTHWYYAFHRQAKVLDYFATVPDNLCLTPKETLQYKGDAALLGEIWGIDFNSIKEYLKWWQQPGDYVEGEDPPLDVTGKAYSSDEFEYGDAWQVIDFAKALGGVWPPSATPEWQHFNVVPLNP